MQADPVEGGGFVVGEWVVVPGCNRLRRRGGGGAAGAGSAERAESIERQLEPRVMELLCHLAGSGGEVLGRERLVGLLWPKVIVNENSLTRAVSELRKGLALPGSEVRYIETISKRGYRLLPPVTRYEYEPGRQEQQRKNQSQGKRRQGQEWLVFGSEPYGGAAMARRGFFGGLSLRPVFAAAAGFGAAAVLGVLLLSFGGERIVEDPRFSVRTVAAEGGGDGLSGGIGGDREAPVQAPDGVRYAYIGYDGAGSTIYLGSLDLWQAPQAVYSSGETLYNLTWSPVGNRLIFARRPGHGLVGSGIDGAGVDAELMQLDLDSLEASRLVPQEDAPVEDSPKSDRI